MNKLTLYVLTLLTIFITSCKDDKEGDLTGGTRGSDYIGLVLNEICGLQNPDDDWIEIYNRSDEDMDIGGIEIIKTDDTGAAKTIHTISYNTTLKAGQYRVIATLSGELTSGISNSKQVGIALGSPEGKTIDKFDRDSDVGKNVGHISGGSYARIPNGTGAWITTTEHTRGIANAVTSGNIDPDTDYTAVRLNELNGNGKYIELYNISDEDIDMWGGGMYMIRYDGEKDGGAPVWMAPAGMTIEAKGFVVLLADQTDPLSGFTSGLSAQKSLKYQLFDPAGEEVDVFINLDATEGAVWDTENPKYNTKGGNTAMGRYPDGTGQWYVMEGTEGRANLTGTTNIEW